MHSLYQGCSNTKQCCSSSGQQYWPQRASQALHKRGTVTRRSASISSEGASQARRAGPSAAAEPPSSSSSGSSVSTTTANSRQSGPTNSGPVDTSNGPSSSNRRNSMAGLLQSMPAVSRKALSLASASEAVELFLAEEPDMVLQAADGELLIQTALDRGNIQLAMSAYDSMMQARKSRPGTSSHMSSMASTSSVDAAFAWPAATLQTTCCLVLGLCRQLAIDQALKAVADIRVQGLPRNDAVGFGKVVCSPLAPTMTLTVVQPQEGLKLVADAFSRYEYEVFSGRVLTTTSEALEPTTGLLFAALQALGVLRRPPPAAVHEFVVQAPDGQSRTFRVATASPNVPAQINERVTFVCAPSAATAKNPSKKRQKGLLSPSPPDTKPGEALSATNHVTGVVTPLLPPPLAGAQATIPGWVLPLAVLAAGGDAASSLLDPALPALLAAGAVSLTGSAVAGNRLLIPRLKQLPEKSVSVEYVRQRLLGQYAQLSEKSDTVMSESSEDIRMLARLWQLENKMQSVGGSGGASGSYVARMERVAAARRSIEERLVKKVELLDGYGRVMNMIEIEVEMDIEVPAAELQGIEEQMVRLEELEGLQDEWRVQAEARDEVERLLRLP